MTIPHIADAESEFFILNVIPDFCQVGDTVVPFDISQTLKPEKSDFAKSVFARDESVIMVKSIIDGIKGNAGSGLASNVSLGAGNSEVSPNDATVYVEDRQVARHFDRVAMNGIASGSSKSLPVSRHDVFTESQKKQIKKALDKQKTQLLEKKKSLSAGIKKTKKHFVSTLE